MGISSGINAVSCAALFASVCAAQFGVFRNLGHTPQAQTQDEFDRYLVIIVEPRAPERVRLAEQFLAAYPDSDLRAAIYEHQLLAYQELNDFDAMLRTGARILPLLPDNLPTLLTLALAMPNATSGRADADSLLHAAESYARRALDVIERKQIPRQIAFSEWKEYRCSLQAQAHEALGHVAMKRGRIAEAVAEFEQATRLQPSPEGRAFFRLGVAYARAGQIAKAREALQRAFALGPDLIRQLASQELDKLER